ncbi:MAG: hypothetical protein ACYCT7_03195 [bacterium]
MRKYFDPLVFDAFIKGFDDIMTIKNHKLKGSDLFIPLLPPAFYTFIKSFFIFGYPYKCNMRPTGAGKNAQFTLL